MKENFLSRSRKFTPQTFFISLLHAAASTNREGSCFSLHRAWEKCGLKLKSTPAKSSFSEYRERVSSGFFKDIFEADLAKHEEKRKKFRGFYIYAIDGDHLELPASSDVLKNGFRGYPISKIEETHYPKMYTAQAVDLINGVTKAFSYSSGGL